MKKSSLAGLMFCALAVTGTVLASDALPSRANGSWQEETLVEAESDLTGPMSLTLLSVSCVGEGTDIALFRQGQDQLDASHCPDPTVEGGEGDWRYQTACELQQGAMLMNVSGRLRGSLDEELVNEVQVNVSLPGMGLSMQTRALTRMLREGECREGMQPGETRRVEKF